MNEPMKSVTREPLAHLSKDGRPHLLEEHLREVGELAATFAKAFDGEEWGRVTGLWHDLGKYAPAFQKMIREENGFEAHVEGDTDTPRDHSTAGAVHAMQKLGKYGIPVALCIAGHHAGLADFPTLISERIKSARGDKLYGAAKTSPDAAGILEWSADIHWDGPQDKLALEFFTRFLFSALCDADFLDTERFYDDSRTALRGSSHTIPALRSLLYAHLSRLSASATPSRVNRARALVLADCWARAAEPPGVFSLTVPTGGGKTLASMAFALKHAETHGLDRVIVVIPFTSIIEQSAEVYKGIFGQDAVLEHHSAFDPVDETSKSRIACENWDAPIVVTTTVQLLESLFAARTSQCRKLHRMARSVIVLDEAQSLPRDLLDPILSMLGMLVTRVGSSLVLCTATQPALGKSDYCKFGFGHTTEIVSDVRAHFESLRRVQVTWPDPKVKIGYQELAHTLQHQPDVLAVVHKRNDARQLVEELEILGAEGVIHLSALMCGQHRSEVLAAIKKLKAAGAPVRLVSTQLIEAGVDVDFAVVYRALGGLDSMAQAAGRCNREGKLATGQFHVFYAESNAPPGIPKHALDVALGMLRSNPNLDLFDQQSYQTFFSLLYSGGNCDKFEIQSHRAELKFREVATRFKLIEDDWSAPLVVRYGEADKLLRELEYRGPSRNIFRRLQRYTINVSKQLLNGWLGSGAVVPITESVNALHPSMAESYSSRFGLVPDQVGKMSGVSLIVDG